MGNIRKEKKKQATFFRILIIIAFGLALFTTALVLMIREGAPKNPNTFEYKM